VAHLQVAAGTGRVFAGALGAADVLDLLAQALEGGVDLQVPVAHHVGVVGSVVAPAVMGLLLDRLGQEAEVEAAAGGAGRTRGSGWARGTLREEEDGEQEMKAGGSGWAAAEEPIRTTGPASPVRPRGPGGPMGPGSPLRPSLPAAPAEPGGPCGRGDGMSTAVPPARSGPIHRPPPETQRGPSPPCSPQDAPAFAGDLLLDRRDQKHQKDLVHQESPVQSKEQAEVPSASRSAPGTWGSTRGHRHPTGLTGGPGGPWRPEKPL